VIGAALLVAAAALSALPRPALTASPTHVVLAGAARAEVRVATPRGAEVVEVSLAPYALDLRGRPRLGGAAPAPRWVSAHPVRLNVGAKGAVVTLTAAPPRGAAPGDRPFALVLTTRGRPGSGVALRLRIGVFVLARVPGKAVRRLVIGPLRVRSARILELTIRNAGNVTERLLPRALVLTVLRRGRVIARLRPPGRQLLPRSRALVVARCAGRLGQPATVRVSLGSFVHRYPLRL
jgi:hypothetical protein